MENNVVANPSVENVEMPQNAPGGVFVPNGQNAWNSVTPVQTSSVQQTVQSVAPQSQQTPSPEVQKEGALDKLFTRGARFFAKISGQPDPITGEKNALNETIQKSQNVVGKVRGAANQAVEKASEVAHKTTAAVTQATEKIQKVIPAPIPVAPVEQVAAPVDVQPVAPVEQVAAPVDVQPTPPTQ